MYSSSSICDKFKATFLKPCAFNAPSISLNLSQIDDNEYIAIDYAEGSYSYQLPFTINLEDTKKQIENIISYNEEKIELDNITIFENGLIEGHDFENYDIALDAFMDTLQQLRRNI